MRKNLIYFFTLIGLLFMLSCEEDATHLDYKGEDNTIASFSLVKGEQVYPLTVYSDSIVFNTTSDFEFVGLSAKVVVEDRVVITPAPSTVTDWSENMIFTVTSANGQKQRSYRYIVHVGEGSTAGEKVFDKVVFLRTQDDVNNFGAEGYTKVAGIVINSSEEGNITDLSPLSTIEEIEYNLQIEGFYGESLNGGFSKLKKVTTFNIKNNYIKDLTMPELSEVTNILIGGLSDVSGLNAREKCRLLTTISFPRLIRVKNNCYVDAAMETMEGFSKLQEVGTAIEVRGFECLSLAGLENITELDAVSIISMYQLKSLEGLKNLKKVRSSLTLQFLVGLETLDGLNLEKLGYLNINNCQRLKDISALSNVTNLTSLLLSGLPRLESLEGLHNVTKIAGNASLRHLGGMDYSTGQITGLADLNGLRSLETVAGDFKILACSNLSDISTLSNVTTFGRGLALESLSKLESLEGLSNVTTLRGDLVLGSLTNLVDLEGLRNITKINGTLRLESLGTKRYDPSVGGFVESGLADVDGLRNLEAVMGNIEIRNCPNLNNVEGLSSVTNLGRNLVFANLSKLNSLEGLHNITRIEGLMSFENLGNKNYTTQETTGLADLNGLRGLSAVLGDIGINNCPNLGDYSGLSGIADSFNRTWTVQNNKYNPTLEDFKAGKYTE